MAFSSGCVPFGVGLGTNRSNPYAGVTRIRFNGSSQGAASWRRLTDSQPRFWGSPRNIFNVGLIGRRVKKTPPPLAHEALVEGNQVVGGLFAVAAGYQLVLNLLAFT